MAQSTEVSPTAFFELRHRRRTEEPRDIRVSPLTTWILRFERPNERTLGRTMRGMRRPPGA